MRSPPQLMTNVPIKKSVTFGSNFARGEGVFIFVLFLLFKFILNNTLLKRVLKKDATRVTFENLSCASLTFSCGLSFDWRLVKDTLCLVSKSSY